MELDQMIGRFDKMMHEHGRWVAIALFLVVALVLFLLWVFATRRMPEGGPTAAAFLRHLL